MGNPNWETPQLFFDRVSRAWGPFGLDAAADEENRKVKNYLGPDHKFPDNRDSLATGWRRMISGREWPNVWLNPPYNNLLAWVSKAAEESDKGLTVVMLLPLGQWAHWFEVVKARAECVHVVGRIKFGDPEAKGRLAPMGMNFLAIFRPPVKGVTWPVGFVGASIKA